MDSQIDNEYFERYKRHILIKNIGGQGQKKLGQAKVLLIGLGGIGSTVLQHLAAAGIGKIGLVDQDTVALSNLQRQTIYKYEDIGRKKVSVASNFVKKLNKNVEIAEYNFFLSGDVTTKIIAEYDVWRKVIDHDDVTGWMHSKLLTGRRTALITDRVTKIYKTSEDNSEIVGYAERNVIMELQYCKSQFCKVAHSDLKGWIKRDSFWGLIEDEKLN